MRSTLFNALIIGLLTLLGGCSALRLAYDQGPQLAWWWLDGYADFEGDEALRAKALIRQWFAWHRPSQLPDWAAQLAALQRVLDQPVTADEVCRWNERLRRAADPSIERALDAAAELVPGLGEAQLRHIEQRYAKGNDELRAEHLQADPAERRAAAEKRTVERFETFYGRLDEAQRRLVAAGLAESPFDPEAWLADRQRRQRDTVQTLRRLLAEKADRAQVSAALRQLAQRLERSSDPAYRELQQHLVRHNCAFVARVHNSTRSAQRQLARDKLNGWERDLRALIEAPQ